MFGHVNERECSVGRAERSLYHCLGGTNKGVDRSVGGRARVNIQQTAAVGPGDSLRDGIYHLEQKNKGKQRNIR